MTNKQTFSHIVDLNERGSYRCHVEAANGETVWSADNEGEDENGEFWPVRDGFMRHTRDMVGLFDYLRSMGILPEGSNLVNLG